MPRPAARNRTRLVAAVALALFALPGVATAAPPGGTTAFHADTFSLSHAPGINLLNLAASDVLLHMWPSVGFAIDYARAPVTLRADGDDGVIVSPAVESRFRAELHAAFGFLDRVELGLAIPFVLGSSGGDLGALGRPGERVGGSHMGDIRVTPKVRLVDPADASGFGLALGVVAHVPTGDEGTFASYGALLARPFVALDWRHRAAQLHVVLNLGYGFQPAAVAGDIALDDTVSWGLGVRRTGVVGDLALLAAVSGRVPVEDAVSRATPIEGTFGAELRLGSFVALAGAGARFGEAVGAAELRVFIGFSYAPAPVDSDGDGIDDHEDACPFEAEDFDGFEDADGCPDADNDGDGIPDTRDGPPGESGFGSCRDVPEDREGDEDGCPEGVELPPRGR